MKFILESDYQPTGDQPKAIEELCRYFESSDQFVVLLGVTGSGKTFTAAHLIQNLQRPTLVISHNKTLAAQLYQEFRDFFPQNAVSYFVSYYDYYQPEAYVPQTDTYITKEANINQEIDKLRLETTSQLFSRKDVIVVASVSCIYNIGSPEQYQKKILQASVNQKRNKDDFLSALVSIYYQRTRLDLIRGTFRLRGESVDVYPPYADEIIRISWSGEIISQISSRPIFGGESTNLERLFLYPAKHYLTDPERQKEALYQIREDLKVQVNKLQKQKKLLEANRLQQRVDYDLEMIKEIGYVNGIENYSRYFDGRMPGEAPFTLLDHFRYQFKNDFLVVIDESHMTVPQLRGMYRGDLARKNSLVDFGFRLPSCLDNRPLQFSEILERLPQTLFVSATPDEWEIIKSGRKVVEQLIRPTGLVDPEVTIHQTQDQISDIIKEIKKRKERGERVLITTLTKKMAEELSRFLSEYDQDEEKIKVQYLHADIGTLQRSDILADLRSGEYDVVVGVNLLREGLDLPEVSLVIILDADKQGFLRSKTALIQTMGRTARNSAGEVILYADEETQAIKEALTEVARRRQIQIKYNRDHKIIPQSINKPIRKRILPFKKEENEINEEGLTPGEAKKLIKLLNRQMRQYAKILDFEKAATVRNRIEKIKGMFKFEN